MIIRHAVTEMDNNMNIAKRAGLITGCLHITGFSATVMYVTSLHNPQAGLVWIYWIYIDMPISLIYFAAAGSHYDMLMEMLGDTFLAQLIHLPHFIHGLLGTIWWYFLPRLFIQKRFGGIWGAAVHSHRLSGRNDPCN